MNVPGLVRGCGKRQPGGIYWEVPTSEYGQPVEYFLVDPPVRLYPERLRITAVGMHPFVGTDGVTHVIDIVGQRHYRNVLDFIEEVRRFGVSRRIAKTFDFKALDRDKSMLMVAHARALIDPWPKGRGGFCGRYHHDRHFPGCPKGYAHHPPHDDMCVGGYWIDIEDGVEVPGRERLVEVTMPSFSYRAYLSPPGKVRYHLGIFARFPLRQFTVINDPEQRKHEKAIERLESAGHAAVVEDS